MDLAIVKHTLRLEGLYFYWLFISFILSEVFCLVLFYVFGRGTFFNSVLCCLLSSQSFLFQYLLLHFSSLKQIRIYNFSAILICSH